MERLLTSRCKALGSVSIFSSPKDTGENVNEEYLNLA